MPYIIHYACIQYYTVKCLIKELTREYIIVSYTQCITDTDKRKGSYKR